MSILTYVHTHFFTTELGPGATYVTDSTSEKIKAGTAFARACEVCVFRNLGLRHLHHHVY